MKKIYPSAAAALDGLVKDGLLIGVGGFGLCGIPEALIDALTDVTALTVNVAVWITGPPKPWAVIV